LCFVRRLLTGLVLAYAGASLVLGGDRSAKPVFHGLTLAWVGLLVVGHSLWNKERPKSRPSLGFFRALCVLEIIAFNLALTIALAEVTLRAFTTWAGTSLVVSDTLNAHQLVPGHDYGSGLRGNRWGYPGPDWEIPRRPGVHRIAALGDSFALGPAVPFAANYLTLLGRQLSGAEVYNFGVTGAGPREYSAVLRRDVWTFHPDLVLLSVFVGNDVTETLATPRHMDPRQHSVYLLLTRGWRLVREQYRRNDPAPPAKRLPHQGLSPEVFREIEARRLAVCLPARAPALEKKWQRALGDLDRIVNDCRRQGVPLAVVLIPDEFQVNPQVEAEAVREAGVKGEAVDLDLPQRRLGGFFTRRDVPCLDLAPTFRRTPNTYAPRDTHWNARGNRLAAARIGRWLVRRYPVIFRAAATSSLK
jgi:hypothetical protein